MKKKLKKNLDFAEKLKKKIPCKFYAQIVDSVVKEENIKLTKQN